MGVPPPPTFTPGQLLPQPSGGRVGPPPPPTDTEIDALAVLLPVFGSVLDAFSPTVAVFVIVWPLVPVFTVAVRTNVAVELGAMSPNAHVPVEVE